MDERQRTELQRRTERWFIKRGLPHFIAHYSVRRDVLTRAAPFLVVVFMIEMLSTFSPDREGWGEVLPFIAGIVLLLGSLMLVNRLRGRRLLQRPDAIGPVEVAVFLLAPAAVSIFFHDDPLEDATAIVVTNLVLLAAAFLVTSYGLLPMSRWAVGHLFRQLSGLANLIARALPLMLLFATVLFLTVEFWEVAAEAPAPFFVIMIGMLVAVGMLYVLLRVPRELAAVSRFDSWGEVRDGAGSSPLAGVAIPLEGDGPNLPAPSGRAWANVGLLMVFSQGVQILLVSILIGLFYLVFGLVAIRPETMQVWVGGGDLSVIAEWTMFGSKVVFPWELVRVSLFVAAFSGLQFTVSVLIDSTYRHEFFAETVAEVRESLAVRAIYLEAIVPPDR